MPLSTACKLSGTECVILKIDIRHSSTSAPDALALFGAGHDAMQSLFPNKRKIPFSAAMLDEPMVTLLLAYQYNVPVGCCAVFDREGYCELKKLYVRPDMRGFGIAEQLIERAEDVAQSHGAEKVMLESGTQLHAAHRLYQRLGYAKCDAFSGHKDVPDSLFFEKSLDGNELR